MGRRLLIAMGFVLILGSQGARGQVQPGAGAGAQDPVTAPQSKVPPLEEVGNGSDPAARPGTNCGFPHQTLP